MNQISIRDEQLHSNRFLSNTQFLLIPASHLKTLFDGNCQRGTYIFYREYIPSPPSEVYVPLDITTKKKHSMSRTGLKIGMQTRVISPHQPIFFLHLCEPVFSILSFPTCSQSKIAIFASNIRAKLQMEA